jgi:hypothetical protein
MDKDKLEKFLELSPEELETVGRAVARRKPLASALALLEGVAQGLIAKQFPSLSNIRHTYVPGDTSVMLSRLLDCINATRSRVEHRVDGDHRTTPEEQAIAGALTSHEAPPVQQMN